MRYDTQGVVYDQGNLPYDGDFKATLVTVATHSLGYGQNRKRRPYEKGPRVSWVRKI